MPKYDYPHHPGQTHAEPYYCTIPLDEYENIMRESNPSRIAWKKAYEEKRKNDPQRIAYRRQYNKMYYERKKKEKELECKL